MCPLYPAPACFAPLRLEEQAPAVGLSTFKKLKLKFETGKQSATVTIKRQQNKSHKTLQGEIYKGHVDASLLTFCVRKTV